MLYMSLYVSFFCILSLSQSAGRTTSFYDVGFSSKVIFLILFVSEAITSITKVLGELLANAPIFDIIQGSS
jgi:hypothetical protein